MSELHISQFVFLFFTLLRDIEQHLAPKIYRDAKGHLISKTNCQAEDSSKKRTIEFVFTNMRRVFVRFLEESSARKKTFRDYLTFRKKYELHSFLMLGKFEKVHNIHTEST